MTHKHTNRLAREKSPYLLQHAHNPVDWFAWGEEAFAKARAENKIILLSIGYSTCHWCHVMERESFEDEKIGTLLREDFVSIKVDREERPDVDKIYMSFVQSTSGSGGWPLNVFLTPDLKPFFGGTYFPPDDRHGRPSFSHLLGQVAKLWRERNTEVLASADELHARLEISTAREAGGDPDKLKLELQLIQRAAQMFKDAYDPRNGGFGGAPKFPQPSIPSLLLRYAQRAGDVDATRMVLNTCKHMAAGGIHDQLGGGFSRYAVDAEWLVPHFEKMLYDNAQLAQLYLDSYLVQGKEEGRVKNEETNFGAVARDILDYVLRDMTHPEGGFYSAEDADSEGQEGKFYCWTHDELAKLLSPEEFIVAARYYGITKQGNFVDHSHPDPLPGLNVLSVVEPIASTFSSPGGERAKKADRQVGPTDSELLEAAKAKMLAVRAKRVRPGLDDKVLASWNGLMLGAFARASVVLDEPRYRVAAERNITFIREKLWVEGDVATRIEGGGLKVEGEQMADGQDRKLALTPALSPEERGERSQVSDEARAVSGPGGSMSGGGAHGVTRPTNVGTLYHRWREGERDGVQLLEGYAFMLDGVVQLYEATLEPKHLDFAIALAEAMIAKFYDPENGGFWQSTGEGKDLILRVKDDYDGAEPSGNSVAVLALLKLAAITEREDFKEAAEATLRLFASRLQQQPHGLAYMLQALDFWLEEPRRVVVAGPSADSADFRRLLSAAHSVYQPNKVVLSTTGAVEAFAKTLPAKEGPMVYLCTGKACQAPTSDAAKVREMLG